MQLYLQKQHLVMLGVIAPNIFYWSAKVPFSPIDSCAGWHNDVYIKMGIIYKNRKNDQIDLKFHCLWSIVFMQMLYFRWYIFSHEIRRVYFWQNWVWEQWIYQPNSEHCPLARPLCFGLHCAPFWELCSGYFLFSWQGTRCFCFCGGRLTVRFRLLTCYWPCSCPLHYPFCWFCVITPGWFTQFACCVSARFLPALFAFYATLTLPEG